MEPDSLFKYVVLCKLAYKDHIDMYDLQKHGLNLSFTQEVVIPVKFIESHNAQCWIFIHGEEGIVVFRGSDSWQDLLHSFPVNFKPFDGVLVHTGHMSHYQQIRDQVLDSIKHLGVKKITLTGHSIGGACAMLCAYETKGFDLDCVIFGSPATGNQRFYNRVQERVSKMTSVVVENDWVPILFTLNQIPCLKIKDKRVRCLFNHNIDKYVSGINHLRSILNKL